MSPSVQAAVERCDDQNCDKIKFSCKIKNFGNQTLEISAITRQSLISKFNQNLKSFSKLFVKMSELPESAPDAIGSAPSQGRQALIFHNQLTDPEQSAELTVSERPSGYSRSIHPNVSLTRVLAPSYTQHSETERSRVSTASSAGTNHPTTPHPNITRVADQRSRSQQTSWPHPNVQANRSKRYSRFPPAPRNTNCCPTRPTREQYPEPAYDPPNSSSGHLTSGSSGCSQSSQASRGHKSCAKLSQNRRSRPKSGGSGRVRPKSSRASQKKSMRQLKIQAPCDSFNLCDNCKASTSKLGSKSSSCIPRSSQMTATQPKSKSSCESMDICSDCREAHAYSSLASCQSSDICEYCGAPKKPSGYSSSGLPSCDSEGDCSDCAGAHRTVQSCQSSAICSQCRAASRSPSRGTSHPSMNSRPNMQVQSSSRQINGASSESARICEDCARKCAASPCSSMSVCKNCSKPITPISSTIPKPSFGSLGRQQHDTTGNLSLQSMNASRLAGHVSRVTGPTSCASCGSKLSAAAKPSGSKVTIAQSQPQPQPSCDCQHSDTDLSKLEAINFYSKA